MNRRSRLLLSLPAALALAAPAVAGPDSPAPPAVTVTVDTSEVPDLEPWGREAKALVEKWHPILADLLASDGFTPPSKVTIVFKKDMRGVAATSGDRITIASDWVKKHPEDKGMVVHELAHVVQSYPPSRAGWLVEGIADYVRFLHYEPETALPIRNPDRASYRDGYRTTARFLGWVEKTHDPKIVSRLNAALRERRYDPEIFRTATGKSLDALWAGFIADVRGKKEG